MRPFLLAAMTLTTICAADGVRELPIVNGSMTQGTEVCTGWDQR